MNFQYVYHKKFITTKKSLLLEEVYYKKQGRKKNQSEIYKKQGKKQGRKKKPKRNLQKARKKAKFIKSNNEKKEPKQWPVNFLRQIETFEWFNVCSILIEMVHDQIQSNFSSNQNNVIRHSFVYKLKEESVSFGGDSFISRVVEIGIVAMGCHPIELPPFWWRNSFRPVG